MFRIHQPFQKGITKNIRRIKMNLEKMQKVISFLKEKQNSVDPSTFDGEQYIKAIERKIWKIQIVIVNNFGWEYL